jgi:hypothetical protein
MKSLSHARQRVVAHETTRAGRLRKTLIAAGVLVAVGISAFVLAVKHYHRSGPPAQERRAREVEIQPLVQSHATRSRVVQALGLEFTDFSVGSSHRQWMSRALYDPSARQRAERYPGVLFHTTALTITWLFFDAEGKLQDYYLCEQ